MECMRHCQYQLQYLKVQNNFTEVLICLFSESPRLFDNFWDDKNTLLALQQCFKINQHVIRDYNPTHNIQICHFNCQSQKEICFILKRCTIFSTGIGHWSYGFSYRLTTILIYHAMYSLLKRECFNENMLELISLFVSLLHRGRRQWVPSPRSWAGWTPPEGHQDFVCGQLGERYIKPGAEREIPQIWRYTGMCTVMYHDVFKL